MHSCIRTTFLLILIRKRPKNTLLWASTPPLQKKKVYQINTDILTYMTILNLNLGKMSCKAHSVRFDASYSYTCRYALYIVLVENNNMWRYSFEGNKWESYKFCFGMASILLWTTSVNYRHNPKQTESMDEHK